MEPRTTKANDYMYPGNGVDCSLTKREYFAALALQALIGVKRHKGFRDRAFAAVTYADELIKELNKTPAERGDV